MRSGKFAPTPAEDGRSAFPTACFRGSWEAAAPPRVHRCAEEHVTEFWPSNSTFRLPTLSQKGPEGGRPRGRRATECAQTRGGARPWIFATNDDSSISTLHSSVSSRKRGRRPPRAQSFHSPLEWYVRAPGSPHLRSTLTRLSTAKSRRRRARGLPRHRCCPHARGSSCAKNQPRSFFDLYSSIFRPL